MRFAFYTDLHLDSQTPKSRADGYGGEIMRKLDFIYRKSVEAGCSCVAFGGDFCNRSRMEDLRMMFNAAQILKQSGLKTCACLGQHDLIGYNPATLQDSSLQHIASISGVLDNMWDSANSVPVPLHLDCGVSFYPMHVFQRIGDFWRDYSIDPARFNILLCHALLFDGASSVAGTIDVNVLDIPFDLVCSGDLHDGYAPVKANGTWFCNPGSVARRSTKDMHRRPMFFIIDIDGKTCDPVIRKCEIPAIPPTEAFRESINDILKKVKTGQNMDSFIDSFSSLGKGQTDIFEQFSEFLKDNKVKEDVIEYIMGFRDEENLLQSEDKA